MNPEELKDAKPEERMFSHKADFSYTGNRQYLVRWMDEVEKQLAELREKQDS